MRTSSPAPAQKNGPACPDWEINGIAPPHLETTQLIPTNTLLKAHKTCEFLTLSELKQEGGGGLDPRGLRGEAQGRAQTNQAPHFPGWSNEVEP